MMDEALRRALEGTRGPVAEVHPVGGGCIHDAARVRFADGEERFVKWNRSAPSDMFPAEAAGLRALAETGALRVPGDPEAGNRDGLRFLSMEAIDEGSRGSEFFRRFGRGLAQLHRRSPSERHGFDHDNYIGSTPQPNGWLEDGVEFVRTRRLGHQLEIARSRGRSEWRLDRLGKRLLDRLEEWLGGLDEPPCLLHGDLWSGNFLVEEGGVPVLVDPAVYYGHREADLAMTRLFGGFPPEFYRAYEEVWPLPPGSEDRIAIHQLYHLLNHLNLFGGSYRSGCLRILDRLVG
ncbi:MAG: fructosamine kinase family protein [Thermoanaerobaculia bacterium]|nr:fructosamine kinase family protein [Thermoanaerobaculia bacterium]